MYLVIKKQKHQTQLQIHIVPFLVLTLAILLSFTTGMGYWSYNKAMTDFYQEQIHLDNNIYSQQKMLVDLKASINFNENLVLEEIQKFKAKLMHLEAFSLKLANIAEIEDFDINFDQENNFYSETPVGGPMRLELDENTTLDLKNTMFTLEQALQQKHEKLVFLDQLILRQKTPILEDKTQNLPEEKISDNIFTILPVANAYVSSEFGYRKDPFTGRSSYHKGMDFAAQYGTEIKAVAEGIVLKSQYMRGYGNIVEIQHKNGYITRYAHNSENKVAVDDTVETGQVIALLGSSGRATGPHLHFEVLIENVQVNPKDYLEFFIMTAENQE